MERPLLVSTSEYDVPLLIAEWEWLVPVADTPLFVSVFADWVFGAPDGSLWRLSSLEGDYVRIAANSREYNTLNKSFEWLEDTFAAGWQEIALRHGLDPSIQECLGWKLHPLLGGQFEIANLGVFSMRVYQSLMGQLHRQLRERQRTG